MRFILLGASNVTFGCPRLWHGLRRAISEPVEVFAAHGHGRSFGIWSSVGPRELPGIVSCRLWDDLHSQPLNREPPRALVTDIGNDLLYGVDPDQIAEWIATCLERLSALSARIALTELPLASVLSLGRARFKFFRSVLFPSSDLPFEDLQSRVIRLNEHILELGRKHGISTFAPRGEWYGFDPIHIRRRHRDTAWRELLASWFDDSSAISFPAAGLASSLRLWRQQPLDRRWFGRLQRATQPTLREEDGSTLWLY